ncbi:MAG: bifunctional anthranilate synthase component I family protein/aminotransferase class IV [Solirubrobacteraceae bacterium]|nr:bifunctional anthranilate synthase component I family protein/aminotransferase class IV [Solirubrobacteraceae bacterium]
MGKRTALRSTLRPDQAVLLLRGERRPFALIGEWAGGPALLGSAPLRVAGDDEDPFELLSQVPAVEPGEAIVGGAWVGWLGYSLAHRIERLPPGPPGAGDRPPLSLAWYDHLVRFDGERWWFESLSTPERAGALAERLAHWSALLTGDPRPHPARLTTRFAARPPGAGCHQVAVADCVERIAAGELFQANIGMRLEARLDGDLVDLAAHALGVAHPRFGALVDGVLSLSPERFLRRDGRAVSTEPIKGTAPRRGPADEDAAQRRALLASSKDAAEHVMIVDLMRNDLGRVCSYGTVRAQPPRVEPHPGVWHMVSTVSGELRDEVTDGALLRATFPPGSVTGAPKVQAMRVISELEPHARHAFTGALGLVSPIAGLDLSVTIRTFETAGDRIWLDVGGAVVADSTPGGELREAAAKARGPLAALGAELDEPARPAAIEALPRALAFGERPDPASGLLETILVEDGEARELREHLARLRESALRVSGRVAIPRDLEEQVAAVAREVARRSRLRIAATERGCSIAVAPAGEHSTEPARLRPVLLPGGLGADKWLDRRLLDALAEAFPGEVPLLVDADGDVLEAAHANVWLLDGECWLTPPADGRILPGVTRARILAENPRAREARLSLEQLRRAPRLMLSSTIRGLHEAVPAGAR